MEKKMTPAELRALHAKSTPGEWEARKGYNGAALCLYLHRGPDSDGDRLMGDGNDVEFIAAAHNNLPAILDRLERERDAMAHALDVSGFDLGNAEAWLTARDARMKALGAAELMESIHRDCEPGGLLTFVEPVVKAWGARLRRKAGGK